MFNTYYSIKKKETMHTACWNCEVFILNLRSGGRLEQESVCCSSSSSRFCRKGSAIVTPSTVWWHLPAHVTTQLLAALISLSTVLEWSTL